MNENKNSNLLRGAIAENPLLVLFLGACPAMATTAGVIPALGMGAAVLLIMLLSNLVIGIVGKLIPDKTRIPAFVLITAAFVSAVQMLMNAYLPNVYQMLGVYLAVAAINLVIINSAETVAAEKGIGAALLDSLLTGIGFALAMFAVAAVREIFGIGSFAGIELPIFSSYNVPLLAKAPGGFIIFSILLAIVGKRSGKYPEGSSFACAASGVAAAETETQGE